MKNTFSPHLDFVEVEGTANKNGASEKQKSNHQTTTSVDKAPPLIKNAPVDDSVKQTENVKVSQLCFTQILRKIYRNIPEVFLKVRDISSKSSERFY